MSYDVYVIGPSGGPLKIGISEDVKKRRGELNVGNHLYLKIFHTHKVDNKFEAEKLERLLHYEYKESHIRGEWFNLEDKDIGDIRQKITYCTAFESDIGAWTLEKKTCDEFTKNVCARARRALNLSEKELADLAGLKENTVKNFESGLSSPRLDTIDALKKVFEEKEVEFIQQQSGAELKVCV